MISIKAFRPVVGVTALLAGVLVFGGVSGAAGPVVAGGADGQIVSVTLGSGPLISSGPLPSVTLPPSGQAVRADVPSATVLGTDASAPFEGRLLATRELSVSSNGSAGWQASTSAARVAGVDALAGTLTADEVSSRCASSAGDTSGSSALVGGRLVLSDTQSIALPAAPAPNTTLSGTNAASGAGFKVVLNEQSTAESSITVAAVHLILSGPSAGGDLTIGRTWCATRPGGGSSSATTAPAGPAGRASVPGPGKATSSAAAGGRVATSGATQAAATAVKGGACGYISNVGLFGGPQILRGCGQPASAPPASAGPSVALPPAGSPGTDPLTAEDPDGAAGVYGPATIFGGIWPADVQSAPPSGPMKVSTKGSPGDGTVTSSADILLHATPPTVACEPNPSPPTPKPTPGQVCRAPGGFGPSPVEGDSLRAECSATGTTVTGTTKISKGILSTTTSADGSPKDQEQIPDTPPVNYTRSGVITNVGDVFTAVFNQQIVNGDGSLTVNAVHMYLFGPTAVGEVIKGQATCGVTPTTVTAADKVAPSCGSIVVEPVAPDDPTPKTPRTERIGVFDAGTGTAGSGLQSIGNLQMDNATVAVGNPAGLPYLQFVAGQTGPLPVVATRIDESKPMSWSFEATDKAGNVTRSSQCPTGAVAAASVTPGAGGAGGTGTGLGTAGGTGGTGTGTGAGAGRGTSGTGKGTTGTFPKTGANALRVAAGGGLLLGLGASLLHLGRRRRAEQVSAPAVGSEANQPPRGADLMLAAAAAAGSGGATPPEP